MSAVKKLFFFLSICVLCCSAVFLFLLTAVGFLYGVYSLFFGEPELNGIVSSRTVTQAVAETLFCCLWLLGFGTAFVADIAVLRKIIRNPQQPPVSMSAREKGNQSTQTRKELRER